MSPSAASRQVLIGRFGGAFGVRGEVRIISYTAPIDRLFRYQPWLLRSADGRERIIEGAGGRRSRKGIIARLPGIEDRDAAEAICGTEIWVPRCALPPPRPGEYYWVDLEGMRVVNVAGIEFGRVSHLFSTGANDVLVVRAERERMLPFIQPEVIRAVDFDAGLIRVDWDADF